MTTATTLSPLNATTTTARTEWADVTLAEFAALDLAASPDAVARVHAYWQSIYAAGKTPLATEPSRLTDHGAAWLSGLRRPVILAHRQSDAAPARKLAHEIIAGLGMLTSVNA